MGFADIVIQADATDPLQVMNKVSEVTGGQLADVVINCVNIPGTEMRLDHGNQRWRHRIFFQHGDQFHQCCSLGAEGIGKDVTMLIGNGYCRNHAVGGIADRTGNARCFGRSLTNYTHRGETWANGMNCFPAPPFPPDGDWDGKKHRQDGNAKLFAHTGRCRWKNRRFVIHWAGRGKRRRADKAAQTGCVGRGGYDCCHGGNNDRTAAFVGMSAENRNIYTCGKDSYSARP